MIKQHIEILASARLLLVALFLSGCATIISGQHQDIAISSSPAQAQVKVERTGNNAMITAWEGTTPASLSLRRKYSYLLTLTLDGYQPVEMGLENGMNGWVWGNLLFGGIIGLIVDFSNGAAKTLEPDEIDVQLVSVSPSANMGGSPGQYAVFRIKNRDGSISSSVVPLVRNPGYTAPY